MEILFALAVVKSTSVEITNKFCEVLSRHERFFIKFPVNRRDTAEAIVKFREFEKCIISQVVVVIDATHVQFYLLILKVNQTKSIHTQAATGNNLEFLSVAIDYPDSMHDTKIQRVFFKELKIGMNAG